MTRLESLLSISTIWLSRLYLLAFFIFVLLVLPDHRALVGTLLQQGFIVVLLVCRLYRRTSLFVIPDEMLICLPYFWALATLGSAAKWFIDWQFFFLPVFAMSILWLPSCNRRWFAGGLRHNSLLQAVYCALIFVLVFATGLRSIFPPFTGELYSETIMNTIVFFAGIPVCLAAAGSRSSS